MIKVGVRHPHGEDFAKFCEAQKIAVQREDSILIFNNEDHNYIMALWDEFCEKDLAEVWDRIVVRRS